MSDVLDFAREDQRRATAPEHSAWVEANAGTGKTKVLTDRVTRLLLAEVKPERILCLTFTKAAAAEMRNRLSAQLGRWAMADEKELDGEIELLIDEKPTPEQRTIARRLFARVLHRAFEGRSKADVLADTVPVDASEIQHEARRQPDCVEGGAIRRRGGRRVESGPDGRGRVERASSPGAHEGVLLGCEEDEAGRPREEARQHAEIDRGVLLRRGQQHRAVRDERQPEIRRGVAVGPEEDEVVLVAVVA